MISWKGKKLCILAGLMYRGKVIEKEGWGMVLYWSSLAKVLATINGKQVVAST
jgi:hypothetical protein